MDSLVLLFVLVALTGSLAGFLSGVLGVGGGIVIVPVLYYVFTALGFSIDSSLHIAIGTSLATITLTQARSALSHYKRASFEPLVWRKWALPIAVGALVGGFIAGWVSGKWLAFIFSGGVFAVALVMIYRSTLGAVATDELHPPRFALASPILYPIAFLSGVFSAITGVGGGTFNVAALTLIFRLNIRAAIGTSAALGVVIGFCGTLVFIISGLDNPHLIAYSFGYVNVPAAILIIVFSVLTAPLGAAISHRIEQGRLQFFFALMLVIAAANMFFEGWQA